MKKYSVFAFFILLLLLPQILAVEIPAYKDKYVNDFAGIFSAGETLDLRNLLYGLDMNTTAEVVVVTVDSCQPYTPLEYSLKIGETWKVGKADKDNGLVILYCKAENKIAVSSGYGLEGILPDSKIGRYLDDYYVPLRDSNQTKEGIIAVTEQYAQIIYDNKDEVLSGKAGGSSSGSLVAPIIFAIIFALAFIFIFKIIRKKVQEKQKGKISAKSKVGVIPIFLDIIIWIMFIVIAGFAFNIILLIIAIILLILRSIFFPYSTYHGIGFFGSGGGLGGGSSGGFGGGGFGGGGFGGGGASR